MRYLRKIVDSFGAAGVIGIGLLLFCALFYFSGVKPLQRELAEEQAAAERLKTRTPIQLVSARDRGEEIRRFYGLFPTVDQLPKELDRVYAIAKGAELQVQQAEYRLEAPPNGLIAYRLTFPVRGTYSQIRNFVSTTLQDMTIASLDQLRFERKKANDTQLEAQVRLTIHFRPGGEEPVRPPTESEEAK
jgi:hypothetical protein